MSLKPGQNGNTTACPQSEGVQGKSRIAAAATRGFTILPSLLLRTDQVIKSAGTGPSYGYVVRLFAHESSRSAIAKIQSASAPKPAFFKTMGRKLSREISEKD
jgi:hypothetical protein